MNRSSNELERVRMQAYAALDRHDYSAARAEIKFLYALAPQEALELMTALEIEAGNLEAATAAWEALDKEYPGEPYTIFLQARIVFMRHEIVSALRLLQGLPVLDLPCSYQEKIYNLLGQCWRILGEGEQSAVAYFKAAEAAEDPQLAALEYSNYLFNLHYQAKSLPLAEERKAAVGYSAFFSQVTQFRHLHRDATQEKLHIGYISPDFREHVCLYFIYGLLTAANAARFQVYAYSAGVEDKYTRLLSGKVRGWRNIAGMEPARAARLIYEDGIDILVDFSGHEKNNCLPVLAYRPAPIQMSGIGYFASTGLSTVDYFLSDIHLAARGAQAGFTEELLALPHSHFCYTPMSSPPACTVPPCQKNGYITFGSFNNFAKINEKVLATWRKIMERMPQAKLLLKNDNFSHEESAGYAKEKLVKAGLDMARVECRPFSRDYLEEYRDIDIALDTFPYPGGGTSCDALYMGVPLVSMAGNSHGERFGFSLLTNLGLSELCATDMEGYIERSVGLASDYELLANLHQSLRQRMEASPVMMVKNYVRDVEEAYESIWQKYCRRQDGLKGEDVHSLARELENFFQAGDYRQALACVDAILAAKTQDSKQLERLVEVCLDVGVPERAEMILQQCLQENTPYHNFLRANICYQRKDYRIAIELVKRAIDMQKMESGHLGAAYHLLANAHKALGEREQAARAYLNSSLCKTLATGKAKDYSNYLLNLTFFQTDREKYLHAARGYGALWANIPSLPLVSSGAYRHKKWRIGYLSADFNRHVVACFAQAFFRDFDEVLFDVYGYQLGENDDITARFASWATVWRDIRGMSAQAAAELICADEIDILVDLGGHTAHNGLAVMAYRPARVQLSGIGYFASTGLAQIDYFLVDQYTAGLDEDQYFTEKLLRLPQSHLCWQPLPGMERDITPAPFGETDVITFGSLNQWDKVTDVALLAWAEILQALPDARLLVKSGTFDDESRREREKKRLAKCGISFEQVMIEGRSADYLEAYSRIDIALDTYPYVGGGTTCDALYMGVPVITLRGNSHHGRFGYSLLANAGLMALCVADSWADYTAKAVALAKDRQTLRNIRQTLRRTLEQTPVMNGSLYMKDMEAAYLQLVPRSSSEEKELLGKAEAYYQQSAWEDLIRHASGAYAGAGCEGQFYLARYLAFAYYQIQKHIKTCYWAGKALTRNPQDYQMIYLQASAYDQAGELSRVLTLAEQALSVPDKLSQDLYKLFCHLRSLVGYKLGHPRMSDYYWQSFLVERDADMYSSYLLTYNCQDADEAELFAKSCGYRELYKEVQEFCHVHHKKHKRLRIGYISPDFRFHVMYKFYQVLLGGHNQNKFEVYAYSLTAKVDGYTELCAKMAEHWRDVHGLIPQEAARRIYEDEIDILFDLSGHTAGGSLPVLARKPAPVQLSGLGYMATTGLPAVDYFVTDSFVDPPGQNDQYFTEKLLRLTSQFCYTPERALLPASDGAPCQARGWVLFGVFNAYRKFTEEMLFTWKEILEKVSKSKLLLKCQVFFSPAMVAEAYERFQRAGFDMERVIFESATREYMERYLAVDIALDTYPYPGGGTTCDALYMGVPVITRCNSRHSTRFSYSILSNVGLAELAADSRDGYVQRAVELAEDVDLLDALHKNLRGMMEQSPLMCKEAYIGEMEKCYEDIWQAQFFSKGD